MKVVIAAGGTGGHINPALSLAQEIKNHCPDAEILFIGTKDRLEATLVPKAGFDFRTIDISGFERSFSPKAVLSNLGTLKKLLFVTGQCKKILEDFSPDAAVGFGGYVSGPVIRTAHKMGIKTAIHEQNAFPGKTNIALSKYVDAVMLTSPDAEKFLKNKSRVHITGLPVRKEILTADRNEARRKLGIPEDRCVILATGGSLGAASINEAMCDVIKKFASDNIEIIHGYGQNGKFVPEKLREAGIDTKNYPNLHVTEYIYDMATYMAAADLVISRAGASSLAEIQVLGKASYLIPYPYATENHQYYNALTLVNGGAAEVSQQKDFTSEKLIKVIEDLLENPAKYHKMGVLARNMAITDAQKKIFDIVFSLINK